MKYERGRKQEGLGKALDVLNGSVEEALLAHVWSTQHTYKAYATVLFGLREGSLNGLFALFVELFADRRFRKVCCFVRCVLPGMPLHHPSCC